MSDRGTLERYVSLVGAITATGVIVYVVACAWGTAFRYGFLDHFDTNLFSFAASSAFFTAILERPASILLHPALLVLLVLTTVVYVFAVKYPRANWISRHSSVWWSVVIVSWLLLPGIVALFLGHAKAERLLKEHVHYGILTDRPGGAQGTLDTNQIVIARIGPDYVLLDCARDSLRIVPVSRILAITRMSPHSQTSVSRFRTKPTPALSSLVGSWGAALRCIVGLWFLAGAVVLLYHVLATMHAPTRR